MVRRSFRIGLRLGVLGGIVAAVVKTVQGRRPSSPSGGAEPAPAWSPSAPMPEPKKPADVVPEPAASPAPAPAPVAAPSAGPVVEPEAVADVAAAAEVVTPGPAKRLRKAPPKKAAAPTVKKAGAAKKAAPKPATDQTWVDPEGGFCPATHPVKAKLSSRLYHLPGMLAYDRTRPDRCYADEPAATADGLTKAKR